MRWFWQKPSDQNRSSSILKNRNNSTPAPDGSTSSDLLASLTQTQTTVVSTAILTTLIIASSRFYRKHLRRVSTANYLPAALLPAQTSTSPHVPATKSLFGTVTSVGDADNFRFYHTPGGILTFWAPFPIPLLRRKVPDFHTPAGRKELRDETIHVRIAGIDAPELAHFGKPGQPHSEEALEWLKSQIMGRRVRIYTYRRDQYERVVATVKLRRLGGLGIGWPRSLQRDIGMEMVRSGMAGVYEANKFSCFGSEKEEKLLRGLESDAQGKKLGMWQGSARRGSWKDETGFWSAIQRWFQGDDSQPKKFESPRDFKTRMREQEQDKHK